MRYKNRDRIFCFYAELLSREKGGAAGDGEYWSAAFLANMNRKGKEEYKNQVALAISYSHEIRINSTTPSSQFQAN